MANSFSNLMQDPMFNMGLALMSQWKTPYGQPASLGNALQMYGQMQQQNQLATMNAWKMEEMKRKIEKERKQEELVGKMAGMVPQYTTPSLQGSLPQNKLGPGIGVDSEQGRQLLEQELGQGFGTMASEQGVNPGQVSGTLAEALQRINSGANYPMQGTAKEMPLLPQEGGFDKERFMQDTLQDRLSLNPEGTLTSLFEQEMQRKKKEEEAAQWKAYVDGLPPEIKNNPAAMAVFSASPEFAGKIGPGVLPSVLRPKEQKPVEYTKGRNKYKVIPDMSEEQAQTLGLQYIKGVGAIAKGELDKPQTIVVGQPRGAGKPPVGYRYKSDGNLEAIPGGPAAAKQQVAKLKDVKAFNATQQKFSNAIRTVDEILDPANTDGFQANFGGYNAYGTRMLSGKASDTRKKLDSLKSSMKMAGLELIRQGGSIGQMTEKEWPIVEQMLAAIDPVLSEEEARYQLQKVKEYFQGIIDRANEMAYGQSGNVKFLGFE